MDKQAPFPYSKKDISRVTLRLWINNNNKSTSPWRCIPHFFLCCSSGTSPLKVTSCFSIFFCTASSPYVFFRSLPRSTLPTDRNFCLRSSFNLAFQAFPPSAPTIWQPPCACTVSSPLLPNVPVRWLMGRRGSQLGSLLSPDMTGSNEN